MTQTLTFIEENMKGEDKSFEKNILLYLYNKEQIFKDIYSAASSLIELISELKFLFQAQI